MAASSRSSLLRRTTHILGFFIGVFGALAILGVFFKITGDSFWGISYEVFMKAGFMGEAGAFIIMGGLELISAFYLSDESDEEDDDGVAQAGEAPVASVHRMMDEATGERLEAVMTELVREVQGFGREIRAMSETMNEARTAAESMRAELEAAGGGQLTEETKMLSRNVQRLSQKLGEAGGDMERVQAVVQQLRVALGKTQASDLADDAERFGQGMKHLSDEVHQMSGEMRPARAAMRAMRKELERVTDGNLAEDAEQLGQGMESLGREMRGAGESVEAIREDLDRMAARFRQFNDPKPRAQSNGRTDQPTP